MDKEDYRRDVVFDVEENRRVHEMMRRTLENRHRREMMNGDGAKMERGQSPMDRAVESLFKELDNLECVVNVLGARLVAILEQAPPRPETEGPKPVETEPAGSSNLFMMLGEVKGRIQASTRRVADIERRAEV